jgi:ABC-2 type transport system permease protein
MTAQPAVAAGPTRAARRPAGALRVLAGRALRTTLSRRGVVATVVNALLFFLGFGVVLHGVLTANGVRFGQFFPPSIVVQTMGFVAMGSAFALATDRAGGLLARCRSLPIRASAVVAARLVADAAQATVYLVVVLGVGFGFGFRFQRGPLLALAFLALAVGFAVALAVAVAPVGLRSAKPQGVGTLLFMLIFPLVYLSGAFVPVTAFPGWLQPVVRASPFTAEVEALRALSTAGASLRPVFYALAWIAGLLLVGGWLATRAWRRAI